MFFSKILRKDRKIEKYQRLALQGSGSGYAKVNPFDLELDLSSLFPVENFFLKLRDSGEFFLWNLVDLVDVLQVKSNFDISSG